MAFTLLSPLSLSSKTLSFPFPSTLSSPPLLLRPSKTLTLTLSLPQDPIFLNHLQLIEKSQAEDNRDLEEKPESKENNSNPILSFFKSRKPVPDPNREGTRTWHITDIHPAEPDLLDEDDHFRSPESSPAAPIAEDGVVGEILGIARNVPENSTLGDFLDSFVGKIGRFECVEALERMGEEGLVWSCLFLFEWMGLREPTLVTGRACNVLFRVLGKAGMGEKLLVLFENLPREKQFGDVRVYNAAISGLSCCGR